MKKYTTNQLIKQIADLRRFITTAEAEINNLTSLKDRARSNLPHLYSRLSIYKQQIPCDLPKEFKGQGLEAVEPSSLESALEQKTFLTKAQMFIIVQCSNLLMDRLGDPSVEQFKKWSKENIDSDFFIGQAGNVYMDLLFSINQCYIDLFTDTESLIQLAEAKKEKHQKRLDKLKESKPHSKKGIEEGPKNKLDHDDLIKKILREISRKKSTLKLHLENLSAHRNNRDRSIKQLDQDEDLPYAERIAKRKKWIHDTVSDIRALEKKLAKHQAELESYLLESGSEGEKMIRQYLNQRMIKFEEQKRFPDCADKSQLPFDFFLPDHNLLIEFDGLQHFMPVSLYGGEEGFRDRKRKDTIKTEWAKESTYKLLRIRYDEFITEKLDLMLLNLKLSQNA